ncbi:Coenzyme PQQ synthesis protein E [uncultured archaeon]|nr:Coenzyme PQQ synthesis protein E [uncultured archaeon]
MEDSKTKTGTAYSRAKVFCHPEKLKSLLEGKITAPIHVRLKPTNKCNHDCFSCSYSFEWSKFHPTMSRKDEIPKEKMDEILSDFSEMGVKAITYSGGGEPLIYPHIIPTLEQTINYGIDFAMNTNGQKLSGEKAELLSHASWVRVSANAIDAKTFSHFRKRPEKWFDELTSNIKNFARIKLPSCNLGINFVVHKENVSQIYESVKFFKELGVDNIKLSPVWSPDFFKYHEKIIQPAKEQIEKARKDFEDGSFRVYDTYKEDFSLTGSQERTYEVCYNMQIMPTIGADCGVYACFSKAYDSKGLIGSIKDQSFKKLWFSKETADFFKNFNPKISCKGHQCPLDEKNLLLIDFVKNKGTVNSPPQNLRDINFA